MAPKNFRMDGHPSPATRTRLRKGKLLDLKETPLCECTLYDLEDGNIGIILPEPGLEVPEVIFLEDSRELTCTLSQVHWRTGPYLAAVYKETPVPRSLALPQTPGQL